MGDVGSVVVVVVVAGVKTRGSREMYIVELSDIRSHCSATSSSLSLPFRNISAGGRRRTEKATSHGLPTTLGTCQFTSWPGTTRSTRQKDMDEMNTTMQRARDLALRKSRFTRRYISHYRVRFARRNSKLMLRKRKTEESSSFSLLEQHFWKRNMRIYVWKHFASLFKTYAFSLMHFRECTTILQLIASLILLVQILLQVKDSEISRRNICKLLYQNMSSDNPEKKLARKQVVHIQMRRHLHRNTSSCITELYYQAFFRESIEFITWISTFYKQK